VRISQQVRPPQRQSFGKSWPRARSESVTIPIWLRSLRDSNPEWGVELEQLFAANDDLLQREIRSLGQQKGTQIAHGLSEGMGARKALDLVEAVIPVTDLVSPAALTPDKPHSWLDV